MTQDLFRREVLDAKRTSHLGSISLAQPLRLWMLASLATVAAASIVAFLVFGDYSRRSRVVGQLVPSLGLATVIAPTTGVVAQVLPNEGAHVESGAPLVRVDVPRATATGLDAVTILRAELATRDGGIADLGASQLAQLDAQQAGTTRQLEATRRELRQVEAAIGTKRRQAELANAGVERLHALAGDHYVSQTQIDQQQQQALEWLHDQQTLERQATALRRAMAQMEQTLRELPAQRAAQQAVTRRDRAQVEQERIQLETGGALLVTAPVAGMVTSRLAEPGQAVQAGQPLLSLLPAGAELQAHLLVPSRAIGFVEPGDAVQLRYAAYPYQKFGHQRGTVLRVTRSAVNPGELAALAGNGQASEPYYRVLVALDTQTVTAYGKPEPLRPGMVLEADILSERRKLYEWLLEPLYSLKGTVNI